MAKPTKVIEKAGFCSLAIARLLKLQSGSTSHDNHQELMRKQTIQYTSPLDALVTVTKRLGLYEDRHNMDSEEFFHQYNQGRLSDEAHFVEWANDYRHYLALRQELEQRINHAA